MYLACRELGGALKASLHQSGSWHLAYLERFFEDAMPDDMKGESGRYIAQWPKPSEISPGYTLAFQIIVPAAAVSSPFENNKKIVPIPAPSVGAATEVSIFLLDGEATENECPGQTTMGTKPVGSITLPNDGVVSVVYRERPMPDVSFGPVKAHLFRGVSTEGLENANLRMLVFGENADGSRVMMESVGSYKHDAS